MSGIVLSSSVRQNLLSLQSTADLLATTQNRLSTGKKVNSALDNPTNFFTAASLDSRASDISNLLDGIGNGVQVLQAANTGISSLQKLVDSAKSVANQALQTTVGYSAKSSVSTTISGATADNILGTGAPVDASVQGATKTNNQLTVYTPQTGIGATVDATHTSAYFDQASTLGTVLHTGAANALATGTDLISALTDGAGNANGPQNGDTFTVNGKTITFGTTGAASTDGSGNVTIGIDQTINALLTAIDGITGNTGGGHVPSAITAAGRIQLHSGVANDVTLTDPASDLAKIGLATGNSVARGGGIPFASAQTTGSTKLGGASVAGGLDALTAPLTTSDYLIVNGKTITFHAGSGNTGSIANNNFSIGLVDGDIDDLLGAIQQATGSGSSATIVNGQINLTTSGTADISFAGSPTGAGSTLEKLGLLAQTSVTRTAAAIPQITQATKLSGVATISSDALAASFAVGDTLTVNGQNLTFTASGTASGNNEIDVDDDIQTLLSKIDVLSGNTGVGAVPSSIANGRITLHTGTASNLTISSSNSAALSALGFSAPVSLARGAGASPLNTLTLSIGSTGGGTASSITFGDGTGGTVKTLNDLNAKLSSNNLQATLAADGTLTISTSNDAASATIGTISGTATNVGQAFHNKVGSAPVADIAATSSRNDLVNQYNNILNQITTTAQDASFNGVNLLGGDTLKLTFNETGKSTLSIGGVNFNAAGLGLAALTAGDFKDNESVNKVVSGLGAASSTLRAQASAFGSNLSIVQIRQDFSKNLINVLQTGSSNLTLADTNEEAANSQALSTRQSIAVSALALANQSQQSVLQLLR